MVLNNAGLKFNTYELPGGQTCISLPLADDWEPTRRALATFGVDAGIIDAPGHVIATINRDANGNITGLTLEPI